MNDLLRKQINYVILMQKKIRNPILDNFFIYGSLIGETYFYQFILPILIWCGYQQLGIRIVLTTCIGNILSNMFKRYFW